VEWTDTLSEQKEFSAITTVFYHAQPVTPARDESLTKVLGKLTAKDSQPLALHCGPDPLEERAVGPDQEQKRADRSIRICSTRRLVVEARMKCLIILAYVMRM
jgi:hypothetical protein